MINLDLISRLPFLFLLDSIGYTTEYKLFPLKAGHMGIKLWGSLIACKSVHAMSTVSLGYQCFVTRILFGGLYL